MLETVLDPAQPAPGVIVQGATGRAARRHVALMQGYGTPIRAGVSHRTDIAEVAGVPVFADCAAAVAATGARISVIMVPPLSVLAAMREALEAGIELLVTVTEGMPAHDALRAHALVAAAGARWIGASTPGLAVPGHIKLGFLPDIALAPGSLAVWSKSGTLSYECCLRLTRRGVGQSAWIGVGGDAVKGSRFSELVAPFRDHAPTRAVLVIGEIGGTEEEDLAETLQRTPIGKPVHALLAGAAAPEGQMMGHAGAIIDGTTGTLASKSAALTAAGVRVHARIDDLADALAAEHAGECP